MLFVALSQDSLSAVPSTMMKKFQMVERPLRRPKWRVASRQWDLPGMTMTLLDRRRRLGQPRRNAHRPAGERISQGGRRGTWVLCRGPSGTAALGMCAAFAGPGGRRGARDTGSRETWGLSRLWCIPAVVAYVVCMYRIRARLFATSWPYCTASFEEDVGGRRSSVPRGRGGSSERLDVQKRFCV